MLVRMHNGLGNAPVRASVRRRGVWCRAPLQVAYRHMGDCRHVMLASVDAAAVATGGSQSSILAVDGLGGALELLTSIVEHLDGTLHRRGGDHHLHP